MSDWTKEDYKHSLEDLKKSGFFLPIQKGEHQAYGWIDLLGYDLIQATRENPLYQIWECKNEDELKQRIKNNYELLEHKREQLRVQIFKILGDLKSPQDKQKFINSLLLRIKEQYKSEWLKTLESSLREERKELGKLGERISTNKIQADINKIDLWIQENIPGSPNKGSYKEVFKIIQRQPNPKKCTITHLLKKVHEKYTPKIGDDRLRQIIPKYLNDLPL